VSEKRPPFEDDVVRYYGQYVAVVVAQTVEQAKAAAESIKVTFMEPSSVGGLLLLGCKATLTRRSVAYFVPVRSLHGCFKALREKFSNNLPPILRIRQVQPLWRLHLAPRVS
jgi:Aldehyde oxidase and xanthine dehydrogenase, a/b hammerhead domain